ncbi:MAG: NAD-dependent succinate-semialdehyde dehydrogenase [Chloroflexota bacterium]|nr:NAD-dependent succinate-semialdehyde dehydrogenase [Chloroflexota bacterium]
MRTGERVVDRALIGGEWVAALSGREIEVRNPSNDALITTVPEGDAPDAKRAIDAADAALPAWRALPGNERAKVLRRLFELMLRDKDRLAELITLEVGKPVAEAGAEIVYAAGFIEWSAEEAKRIYGEMVQAFVPNKRILVLRQPIGVTAAITPWNLPAAMITRKLGPALAAGCTMIVKPASKTPLSALAIGELALEAGVPPGVVNVVPGKAAAIAEALLGDARVRALSFTGSTEVGKRLMVLAAEHVTRLGLELGGHAPVLVFDDADIELAVAGAVASKYRNAGQTCICANRIYVQAGIHDRFVAALAAATETMPVGDGFMPDVQIGPLVDDRAVAKVEDHIADALAGGASIVTGGKRVPPPDGHADRFFAPTVVTGVQPGMAIMIEETFGPVAPVIRFENEADAVAMANDTQYGLAAYLYTRDASRLMRVAEALEYGIVGANDGAPSTPQAPFGGVKESGLGREGGKWGLEEYLETKYVSWGVEPAEA